MNLMEKYPDALQWGFGDLPALTDALAALVVAGKKTASCGSLAAYQQEAHKITPGSFHIILDSQAQPVCVIQIVAMRLVRFCDVTAEMAQKEGEGDLSLAYWRQAHQEFFQREGLFATDMELIYEEFRLVEVL